MILINPNGQSTLVEERIVDTESARKTSALCCCWAIYAELATRLSYTGVIDRSSGRSCEQ